MYIKDAIYKPVKLKAPLPLAEGTVLTLGGNIANEDGSDAYGIVAQRVTNLPPSGKINIAVSGTIDLTENKVTFTDNMIHGLHEFNFVPYQESSGGGSFPTPTEDDNGKVLTAGADGTASWQTASGGGGGVVIKFTGTATYSAQDASWECGVDKTAAEIEACFSASTAAPLYLLLPDLTTDSPYYDYSLPTANKLLPAYNLGGSNKAPGLEWGLSKVDDDYIVWVELSTD